ncbi:MAG TPA: PIN domain-containing protein [Vitreimonas sp.]|nr:PIN domain-containing protein [Vitreimonas sp.]
MLIDSNILIYSLNQASPKSVDSQKFLQSQTHIVFAQQNIFETLRILTHTKFPNPFSVKEATEAVRALTDQATVIFPTLETYDLALELIRKYQITGTEIFDAYLVATALSNGIEKIASDNTKHLQKYNEIKVVNPFN